MSVTSQDVNKGWFEDQEGTDISQWKKTTGTHCQQGVMGPLFPHHFPTQLGAQRLRPEWMLSSEPRGDWSQAVETCTGFLQAAQEPPELQGQIGVTL